MTRPEMWPLYIAEVHCAAPTLAGDELVGKALPNDGHDIGIPVNSVPFEDQILAAAVGLDRSPASRLVERPHGPLVCHDGLQHCAADWIGRPAAKRRQDGKKRAEALKTVDADW